MAGESKSFSGSILFRLFWWIVLRINPGWAHKLMYFGLRDGSFGRSTMRDPVLAMKVWGHTFNTPIGIAGGVDKKGNVIDRLMQIGYGFGTFGPYTLEKELPTKQTYYFRKESAILVQSLGFRNPGLLKMIPWFVKRRYLPHYVGVDLAIPAESEDQNIKQGRHFTYQEEFVLMAQKIAPYCDFITLDLSHPNSELSMLVVDPSTMVPMIKAVREAVHSSAPIQTPPVLVKIPLDLNAKEIELVARNLLDGGAEGVVVAGPLSMSKNTLLRLPGMKEEHVGMLTGALVKEQTVNLIRQIYEKTNGQLVIIGCGGVFSAEDALEQIYAGASLIQLDNASLTFAGPNCITKIHENLLRLLKEKNFPNISHAVGFSLKENTVPPMTEKQATPSMGEPEQPSQPMVQQTTAQNQSCTPVVSNVVSSTEFVQKQNLSQQPVPSEAQQTGMSENVSAPVVPPVAPSFLQAPILPSNTEEKKDVQ